MKTLITAVTALLFGCATLFAAPIEPLEDGQYKLTVGDVSMVVDAAHGGKILSFKYGDMEAISQIEMPNAFGSTFWTSPQKEWNWPPVPEYDSMPYTVVESGNVLRLQGPVSERFKYRINKEFATDPSDNSILVTYTITNEADTERSVAPWEITRVPNAGMVIFQAPFESITPAGLLPFKEVNGIAIYEADAAPQNRKVNANGKGWYTFVNHGLMLMKRFQDLEEGEEAPGEAEIQVYVNVGKTFMELECQGPYTTLKPGESLHWTVKWNLVPEAGPGMPGMGAPGQRPQGAPGQRPQGAPGQRPQGAPGQRPQGAPGGFPGGFPGMGQGRQQ